MTSAFRSLYWIVKSWGIDLCSIHTFFLWAESGHGECCYCFEQMWCVSGLSGEKAGKNKGKAFSEGDMLISGYPEVLSAHSFGRWSSQRHLTLNPMWLTELQSTLQDHLPEASAWTCLLVQHYTFLLSLSAGEDDKWSRGRGCTLWRRGIPSCVLSAGKGGWLQSCQGDWKRCLQCSTSALRGSLQCFRDSNSAWPKCFWETKA